LKKEKKTLVCSKCGSNSVDVVKTWNLISPLPDREGRITVTIMGVLKCKKCGYSWKSVVSKLKVGTGIEVEEGKKKKVIPEEERKPKEIIIDLDEIKEE
jgi:ribosomal protein L37AE/L43A